MSPNFASSHTQRNTDIINGDNWFGCAETAMAPHSSTLAWRIPMDGGAWQAIALVVAKSWTRLSD